MGGLHSSKSSSQCLEGCDLVDDVIDGPLIVRFGLFTQYSDEASLEVLESIIS